ncbi:hypothetical protein [Streptomyces sp. NPDC048665]|uniref:hypothetical protein n=1 Tax=Streptomyces sp. NPDC048665 TaxID=3155490 RepID=UPI0034163A0E
MTVTRAVESALRMPQLPAAMRSVGSGLERHTTLDRSGETAAATDFRMLQFAAQINMAAVPPRSRPRTASSAPSTRPSATSPART